MKYELIIKDIESGEVVSRNECDCVCGAVSGIDGEDIVANTVSVGSSLVAAHFAVLAAAQDACDHLENTLYEEFKKLYNGDAPKGLFNEFIETIRSKGVITEGEA